MNNKPDWNYPRAVSPRRTLQEPCTKEDIYTKSRNALPQVHKASKWNVQSQVSHSFLWHCNLSWHFQNGSVSTNSLWLLIHLLAHSSWDNVSANLYIVWGKWNPFASIWSTAFKPNPFPEKIHCKSHHSPMHKQLVSHLYQKYYFRHIMIMA